MRMMRWKIKLNKEIFPITSGHETSLNPVIKRLCELDFLHRNSQALTAALLVFS